MTNPDVKGGGVGFISGSGLGWTVGLWAQLIANIAATMEIHPHQMIFVNNAVHLNILVDFTFLKGFVSW